MRPKGVIGPDGEVYSPYFGPGMTVYLPPGGVKMIKLGNKELDEISMRHMPLLRRRHSMLPEGAGPEIEQTCSSCGGAYPCDAARLFDHIAAMQEEKRL